MRGCGWWGAAAGASWVGSRFSLLWGPVFGLWLRGCGRASLARAGVVLLKSPVPGMCALLHSVCMGWSDELSDAVPAVAAVSAAATAWWLVGLCCGERQQQHPTVAAACCCTVCNLETQRRGLSSGLSQITQQSPVLGSMLVSPHTPSRRLHHIYHQLAAHTKQSLHCNVGWSRPRNHHWWKHILSCWYTKQATQLLGSQPTRSLLSQAHRQTLPCSGCPWYMLLPSLVAWLDQRVHLCHVNDGPPAATAAETQQMQRRDGGKHDTYV